MPAGLAVVRKTAPQAGELFDLGKMPAAQAACRAITQVSLPDFAVIAGLYSPGGVNLLPLPEPARRLYELSVNAFDALVHAWMSELPIEPEMIRFGRKVLVAGQQIARNGIAADGASRAALDKGRYAALSAASDSGDPDARLVLDTAYKVWHEVDRMRGLLRFTPGKDGQYIAHCTPDYCVLPALGEHFTLRFGDTPWAIIDENRNLCLYRADGKPPKLRNSELCFPLTDNDELKNQAARPASDEWEQLWRQYHRTINNESRSNPRLQRQFMPQRYWKNLPEME